MKEYALKSEIAQRTLSDLGREDPQPSVKIPFIHQPFFSRSRAVSCSETLRSAERVGFEPTVAARATTVFETAPFVHSGTSPIYPANAIIAKKR